MGRELAYNEGPRLAENLNPYRAPPLYPSSEAFPVSGPPGNLKEYHGGKWFRVPDVTVRLFEKTIEWTPSIHKKEFKIFLFADEVRYTPRPGYLSYPVPAQNVYVRLTSRTAEGLFFIGLIDAAELEAAYRGDYGTGNEPKTSAKPGSLFDVSVSVPEAVSLASVAVLALVGFIAVRWLL